MFITYKKLLGILLNMPNEQLEQTVTIHDASEDEFFAISDVGLTKDSDVLDENHIVLTIADEKEVENWDNNKIQFPRLIAEIEAAGGFNEVLMNDLCESMDLNKQEVCELIDRAQGDWDNIKSLTH